VSFGELALLNNEGRAATIVCTKPTMFATLNRRDYNYTLREEEKRKLKEMVNFFRGFRIFANQRSHAIEKIFYYCKAREFIRGQLVFQERVSPIDGLYFISEGDFEVT